MKLFDQKFGADYFAGLPASPAVYRIFDAKDALIYVGKAKNLRRRLGQYRNAKRRKKHHKMRKIVSEAARIEYELHASDHEACLAEMKLIQLHRPKWNVAGAFSFLYPQIGLSYHNRELALLYTTEPESLSREQLQPFSLHGAFRSRHLAGDAYFALVELLAFVGHPNPGKKPSRYSYQHTFRQVDEGWKLDIEKFMRAESDELLEKLILALVEKPGARKNAAKVQEHLLELRRFYRHEARPLARMQKLVACSYPVSQRSRDLLVLEYRHLREQGKTIATSAGHETHLAR